jgi:hypothetical protein
MLVRSRREVIISCPSVLTGATHPCLIIILVDVIHRNNAPIPVSKTVTGLQDVVLNVQLIATDPDGDNITYVLVEPPHRGFTYQMTKNSERGFVARLFIYLLIT